MSLTAKTGSHHTVAMAAGGGGKVFTTSALGVGGRQAPRQGLDATVLKGLDRALGAAKLLSSLLHGHIGHKTQTDDLALLVGKVVEHLVQLFVVELCVDC